jgi:hypothetical protein
MRRNNQKPPMKTLSPYLVGAVLTAQALAAYAQTLEKSAPTFALAIEEKPLEAENAPGTRMLLVKYTNASDVM